MCASFKLSPMDHEEIFGASKLPVISNQDTELIDRIISYAHTEQVWGLGRIHNTITGTSSIIKRRPFQVIFANLKANVSKYINNCPSCLKESLRFYSAPEGSTYTKIKAPQKIMSNISADILGWVQLKTSKEARKPKKWWPILFVDINYGCVVTDLLEDYSTESVKQSLKKLQKQYSEIEYLSTDKGSNFHSNNLEDLATFPKMRIRNHPVNSQYRNYVDRIINTFKRYIRTITGKVKKEKLPTLSIMQFSYLMVHVADTVNTTPYKQDQENLYLCPKTFMVPSIGFSGETVEEKEGKLKEYISIANMLRKEQIIDSTERYAPNILNRNTDTKGRYPELNDIVYLHELSKFEKPRFAKIVGFSSPQTAVLRSKRGLEEHPIINIHPFIFKV